MTTPAPFFSLSTLGLTQSPALLLQQWLVAMQTAFPGYQPSQGNLEFVQAQVFASMAADLASLCSQGADALFENFGTQLIQLPFQQGSPAVAVITVTAGDSSGHTLPAGTQVLLTLAGVATAFQTIVDLVIPNGQTSGSVQVAAITVGSALNGAGDPAQLNTSIDWVVSVSTLTVAADGQDPEDQSHYLDRLASELQLIAPRPITATDFATMAPSFTPNVALGQEEVGRASAIDGYDPGPGPPGPGWSSAAGGTNTYNNEREVTVCVTDDDGDALNSVTLAAVQQWFEAKREVNFIVNVVSPNYNEVYVAVTVKGSTGFLAATVQANVQAALVSYIAPGNFGLPSGSRASLPWWENQLFLYRSHIDSIIQNVTGVDHVVNGTLAIDTNPVPTNTTNDLALAGPFPLPLSSVSTIPLNRITVV